MPGKILYWYHMTASTIPSIGIDFGGTSIKLGVVKGTEVIAHAPSIATQEYGNPDQLIEAIASVGEYAACLAFVTIRWLLTLNVIRCS